MGENRVNDLIKVVIMSAFYFCKVVKLLLKSVLPLQPCSKDEECCSDQMCVWGQCTVNATQGTAGTICQGQSDCRPDLCCAFQRGDVEYM